MRLFVVLFLGLILSACSLEKIAEQLLPDNIEAQSQEVVEAVLARDTAFFLSLKSEETELSEFNKNVAMMFEQISEGGVVSEHIVSANINTSFKSGDSGTTDINIGHEIETSEGFTLISTRFYKGPEDEVCCRLVNVNVRKFESSPAYANILLVERVSKVLAFALPVIAVLILTLILRRRGRNRAVSGH